jgi:hypothetical protein
MVELHTDLVRRWRPGWPVEGVWQRATSGRLAGAEARLIALPDALVHLALHARHNLFARLSYLADAALLARRLTPAERAALPALAAAAGARAPLAHLLEVAGRLFGLEDLPRVGAPPGARWMGRRIAGWKSLGAGGDRAGPLVRAAELLLMDSPADAAALGRLLVLPPPAFVEGLYGSEGTPAVRYRRRLRERLSQVGRDLARVTRRR